MRSSSSVHVAVFSDGCDGGGPGGPYFERLASAGSETLDALLVSEAAEHGRPVHVVVYDAYVPAVGAARGAACAAFLTQTCAVNALYTHAWAGRVAFQPPREELAVLPGPPVVPRRPELPPELPAFREVVLN